MATLRHPATTLIRYDVGKSNNLSSRICVLINLRTTMRSCTILIFFVLTMFCRKCSSLLRLPGFSAKTQLNRMVSLRMASTDFSADLQSMKGDLINLMTSTARGSNENNRMEISRLIDSFVAAKSDVSNPIRTQDLEGEWELLYTDDDITRSSPFFWAFRKALRDVEDPFKIVGPKMLSESIFKITDSIPFKSVGAATQRFTADENFDGGDFMRGTLRSSMELKVALAGSSLMTTSSTWRTTEESDLLEIEVEKTEVLESTISTLLNPLLSLIPKQFTENLSSFPSGAALELVKPGSSTVYMRIVFLDSSLRIVKNEADGKTFIYGRSY